MNEPKKTRVSYKAISEDLQQKVERLSAQMDEMAKESAKLQRRNEKNGKLQDRIAELDAMLTQPPKAERVGRGVSWTARETTPSVAKGERKVDTVDNVARNKWGMVKPATTDDTIASWKSPKGSTSADPAKNTSEIWNRVATECGLKAQKDAVEVVKREHVEGCDVRALSPDDFVDFMRWVGTYCNELYPIVAEELDLRDPKSGARRTSVLRGFIHGACKQAADDSKPHLPSGAQCVGFRNSANQVAEVHRNANRLLFHYHKHAGLGVSEGSLAYVS